jgi:HSP20 family protein
MTNMIKRENTNRFPATRPDVPISTWVDGILKNTLNRFFDDDFFGSDRLPGKGSVPVNISETENTYELEFVVPGLRKEDFSVNFGNNVLTVSYEHKEENKHENADRNYLREEFMMQSFTRSFTLDETVDAEKISGQYINGVLHLTIPKKEGSRVTKNIEIK